MNCGFVGHGRWGENCGCWQKEGNAVFKEGKYVRA